MERKLVINSDFPDNIFIRQLREHHLSFYTDMPHNWGIDISLAQLRASNNFSSPITFLSINSSVRAAIEYCKKNLTDFPNIQIIVVRGGQKNFEPIMIFVYEDEEEDYYNYENWADFCQKLFLFPDRQPKFFVPLDSRKKRKLDHYEEFARSNHYQKILKELESYKQINLPLLHHSFNSWKSSKFYEDMMTISRIYINWHRLWAEEITKLKFTAKINYTTNLNRPVKTLEIKVKSDTTFWGLPIFEEDRLIYFNNSLVGQIAKVQENKIIVKTLKDNDQYPRRKDVNKIDFFVIHPNNKMTSFYEDLFFLESATKKGESEIDYNKLLSIEGKKLPWGLLTGFLSNSYGQIGNENVCDLINCSNPETKRLLRDSSQAKALAYTLGAEIITIINGAAGTGKTSVVSTAIEQILTPLTKFDSIFVPPFRGQIILVVSHSNVGLDNLLKSIYRRLKSNHFSEHQEADKIIFRLGNNIESVDLEIRQFHGDKRHELTTWERVDVENKRRRGIIRQRIAHGTLKTMKIEIDDSGQEIFYEQKPKQGIDEERAKANCTAIWDLIDKGKSVILASTLNSLILDSTYSFLHNNGLLPKIGIVDEATRGLFFEFLPVLKMVTDKLILIGDPEQLSNLELPRQFHEFASQKNPNLDIHLFEKGLFNGILNLEISEDHFLETNRRSLPLLASLISRSCYGGRLRAGRFDPHRDGTICFYDISQLNENREKRSGTSLVNSRERNILVKLFLQKLIHHVGKENGKISDLAVIVPYAAQKREIQHLLRKELLFNKKIQQLTIINPDNIEEVLQQTVVTVDAMQGSERDIIFWVLTRSNDNGEIGFMENFNRIRVAVSRPRNELLIIGNPQPFLDCDSDEIKNFFKNVLAFIKEKGKYVILQPNKKVFL